MKNKENTLFLIFIDYCLILIFSWVHLIILLVSFWSIINGEITGMGIIYGYALILIILFTSRWLQGPKDKERKKQKFRFEEWVIEIFKRFFSNTIYVLHAINLGTLLLAFFNSSFTAIIRETLWRFSPDIIFLLMLMTFLILPLSLLFDLFKKGIFSTKRLIAYSIPYSLVCIAFLVLINQKLEDYFINNSPVSWLTSLMIISLIAYSVFMLFLRRWILTNNR